MAKKKKQNRWLPLVILTGVLAVLLIGYSALSAANEKAAEEEARQEAIENAAIMLAAYDKADMATLTYSRNGGDPIRLAVSNGQWVYADDPQYPLNTDIAAEMAGAIASIGAMRRVDEGDKAAFGLTEPSYHIQVTYRDGTSHEYKIGNYNTFSAGYYFEADGEVYIITSGLTTYFAYDLEDLIVLDVIPTDKWADSQYLVSVKVQSGGKSNTITDPAGMETAISAISGMVFDTWDDYYCPAADQAERYQIDGENFVAVTYKTPVASMDANGNPVTNYLETTYQINFGLRGESVVYTSPKDSTIVYRVTAEEVDQVLALLDYVPTDTEAAA